MPQPIPVAAATHFRAAGGTCDRERVAQSRELARARVPLIGYALGAVRVSRLLVLEASVPVLGHRIIVTG